MDLSGVYLNHYSTSGMDHIVQGLYMLSKLSGSFSRVLTFNDNVIKIVPNVMDLRKI